MILNEKELNLPKVKNNDNLLSYLTENVVARLDSNEMPVRFVITNTNDNAYHCELGVLSKIDNLPISLRESIFDFKKRDFENVENFTSVLLIPTGIGAEIGGHAGDAGPVARLHASACDTLITHPNVVNASDINELPENGLYVEGSVITRLLMGMIGLQKVRSNRVMLIIDKHEDKFFYESAINSVSAARAAFGIDCPLVVTMEDKVLMHSLYASSGRAVGKIDYFERIYEVIAQNRSKFDAVALSSVIRVPLSFHRDYHLQDMVNPWGGVEAMLTHTISLLFNIPSAHSPMLESKEILDLDYGVTDPRKAAEIVSVTFLHCILKGLHRSPRIITSPSLSGNAGIISASDISCLVIPDGCVGLPTLAALEQGIPVIAVRENKNSMKNSLEELPFQQGKLFMVANYLEAVGVMHALKSGVKVEAVRRPLSHTIVSDYKQVQNSFESKAEQKAFFPDKHQQIKVDVAN